MHLIDLLHRWTGGLIGLVLALLGATGAVLAHADRLFRPAATAPTTIAPLDEIVGRALHGAAATPDYIIFARDDFPFHRIVMGDGSGRYLDAGGHVASLWRTMWDRPELWLFDLHRHLFLGKGGETFAGLCALAGILFVVTGAILWWRRRRSFAPRILPARLTRPAIMRHHRDLGILVAPLLLLTFVTGATMALKPVGLALVSPWSSARAIQAATAPPPPDPRPPAARQDWAALFADATRRFPDARIRLLAFPRKPGDAIVVRMRQPSEWTPNGRTTLYYAPHDGRLLLARDARALPRGAALLDLAYPLHAAKVGGLAYRIVLTLSGLALALLGTFAVWSFWFRRRPARRLSPPLRG